MKYPVITTFMLGVSVITLAGCGDEIPAGSVMSFNLAECPKGWQPFREAEGRFVLGVNPSQDNGLKARPLKEQGGAETHALALDEMPKHTHKFTTEFGVDGNRSGHQDATYGRIDADTSPAGGLPDGTTKPFEIIPPYVALLYCVKG